MTDTVLTAKIKDINEYGLVTVRFSEKMKIINDTSLIDETVLKISVVPNSKSEQILDKRILNWNVTSLDEREMRIQLNFSNPEDISPTVVSKNS